MNSENKEKSNVEDSTITKDSVEDVELDFTLEEYSHEIKDQDHKEQKIIIKIFDRMKTIYFD